MFMLCKQNVRPWTGFMWLRIGSIGERVQTKGVVLGEACSTHGINSEMELLCRRLEEL
jgi:hypothetical protein